MKRNRQPSDEPVAAEVRAIRARLWKEAGGTVEVFLVHLKHEGRGKTARNRCGPSNGTSTKATGASKIRLAEIGIGRELGEYALEHCTEVKTVTVKLKPSLNGLPDGAFLVWACCEVVACTEFLTHRASGVWCDLAYQPIRRLWYARTAS